VLTALDNKIESNRRLIETAEELGRLELETALAGPDGLGWQYSWPDVPLESVLDVIETGRRPKGGVARYSEGIPSIGAESIVSAGRFDFAKTKYVPEEFFESMNSGKLKSGDVLLYKDGGTPGNFIPHVSMTQDGFPFGNAAINEHVYRLRIKPPFSQSYLYYWLSSQRMLDEMWLRGTGAAIPGLNSSNVKELPIANPDEQLLTSVLQQVDGLISRVFAAAKESRSLQLLRDSLLPELLSGRIRVRDAELIVEEAL
jgi:type I restriction enzyme S subunit